MHRSGSTTRVSDEFFLGSPAARTRAAAEVDRLPTYDPQSEIGKKEAARARFAESMVHAIPAVLIVCAMTLWFFSNAEIAMVSKDVSLTARIENIPIDGPGNWTSSAVTKTLGDSDSLHRDGMEAENMNERRP